MPGNDRPGSDYYGGKQALAAPPPVNEAERTEIGARDRLRKLTDAATRKFQEEVIAAHGQHEEVLAAGRTLWKQCREAAEEYFRNLRRANAQAPADASDPADLTCEMP